MGAEVVGDWGERRLVGFGFGEAVAIFSSVLLCAKLRRSQLQSAIGAVEVGGENAIARPDRCAEMAINTVQTCIVLRKVQNKSVGGDGNLFYSFSHRRRPSHVEAFVPLPQM